MSLIMVFELMSFFWLFVIMLTGVVFIIKSDLVKDKRKINVALSRAKKKLIVVGNWDFADKYSGFRSLFKRAP